MWLEVEIVPVQLRPVDVFAKLVSKEDNAVAARSNTSTSPRLAVAVGIPYTNLR